MHSAWAIAILLFLAGAPASGIRAAELAPTVLDALCGADEACRSDQQAAADRFGGADVNWSVKVECQKSTARPDGLYDYVKALACHDARIGPEKQAKSDIRSLCVQLTRSGTEDQLRICMEAFLATAYQKFTEIQSTVWRYQQQDIMTACLEKNTFTIDRGHMYDYDAVNRCYLSGGIN